MAVIERKKAESLEVEMLLIREKSDAGRERSRSLFRDSKTCAVAAIIRTKSETHFSHSTMSTRIMSHT